jgi:hypothetical protein
MLDLLQHCKTTRYHDVARRELDPPVSRAPADEIKVCLKCPLVDCLPNSKKCPLNQRAKATHAIAQTPPLETP